MTMKLQVLGISMLFVLSMCYSCGGEKRLNSITFCECKKRMSFDEAVVNVENLGKYSHVSMGYEDRFGGHIKLRQSNDTEKYLYIKNYVPEVSLDVDDSYTTLDYQNLFQGVRVSATDSIQDILDTYYSHCIWRAFNFNNKLKIYHTMFTEEDKQCEYPPDKCLCIGIVTDTSCIPYQKIKKKHSITFINDTTFIYVDVLIKASGVPPRE